MKVVLEQKIKEESIRKYNERAIVCGCHVQKYSPFFPLALTYGYYKLLAHGSAQPPRATALTGKLNSVRVTDGSGTLRLALCLELRAWPGKEVSSYDCFLYKWTLTSEAEWVDLPQCKGLSILKHSCTGSLHSLSGPMVKGDWQLKATTEVIAPHLHVGGLWTNVLPISDPVGISLVWTCCRQHCLQPL